MGAWHRRALDRRQLHEHRHGRAIHGDRGEGVAEWLVDHSKLPRVGEVSTCARSRERSAGRAPTRRSRWKSSCRVASSSRSRGATRSTAATSTSRAAISPGWLKGRAVRSGCRAACTGRASAAPVPLARSGSSHSDGASRNRYRRKAITTRLPLLDVAVAQTGAVRAAGDHPVMPQNFIECDRDQELLLPPSLREWLPEGHFAWFVLDAVEEMDLSSFYAAYRRDGHGRAAHEPAMMSPCSSTPTRAGSALRGGSSGRVSRTSRCA